jgi:hypothetical protein
MTPMTLERLWRCAALGMLAALLLAPRVAGAAPLYCVAVGVNSIDCTPQSASPLSSLDVPTGVRGTASAVAGTMGAVSLGAQAIAADTTGFGAGATARAELSGFEVVISGPTGGTTTTSLNLSVSGDIDLFGGVGGDINHGALTVTTILAGSLGTASGQGFFIADICCGGGGAPTITYASGGILQNLFNSGDFATPTLSVVSGETVFLSLSLEAQSGCRDSFGGPCGNSTNYLNTLGLRATGPVFNLPAGWTANSPDGSIVNNQLVAVPEASTRALLAVTVLGTLLGRRRAH